MTSDRPGRAADIQSATLTFNIDDVVGTFGPGTTFDGTAAATIVLFGYSGNGTVDLTDFNNVVGAPLSVVDTTPLGVITDATLAVSGPLVFDIDVTTALETLIGGGATHFGIVFTTNDAGSATSIDNMGPSGAGPAGVGGAAMPFLTVVTGAGEPPVFTPAALTCQKGIAKASQKFVSAKQKALGKCFGSVLADAVANEGFAKSTSKCASGLDVGDPKAKLSKAIAKFQATIADECPAVLPAQIDSPCNPAAPDMAAIASCLLAHHGAQVEAALAAEYGDACALITAVGLDAALPGLCAAP